MAQILVIDDDPTICLLLQRTLTRSGYEVICVNNGQDGLIKAQELCPDLIICDWVMPGLNGLEVCSQVKTFPELATTFFILLTSLGSVEDRVKGLDAGADDFLCKPIEMNELIARVRSGLRLHELSQDLKEQKQLLEAELAEAADYVTSILPEPLTSTSLSIDTRFFPSRQLGGDGFDYFWLDEDHLAIYLLDVSGHGLRAALPSLSVINLLRSQQLSFVDYYEPSNVLSALNQSFQMTYRNDKYFTIWYGVYNQKNRCLIYSSAGHPPAILLETKENKIIKQQLLKTPGFPIGMFLDAHYIDQELVVNSSSSLYIFSDGIYEMEQVDGTVLGLTELTEILKEYQLYSSGDLDLLLASLKCRHGQDLFEDDLSIIQIDFS
ncbi:response regulator receiver modulated serine phosphatase [Rippkaea orientalis PCC 8801]|uniref:Response regulator receiver modulated serine phosphatase n=1 Tax=Rippkaea orientalis (strain PCC 8801 / RF-1) TaxID=41431 RepID=B7JXS3_RIPO1|nr:SpoIIE family protein phosphatase [Rippkaea orientalis]ACK65887.1 response regulator receiver modulated serine phosphatase [Rippkaea orientalis PCC 8801]